MESLLTILLGVLEDGLVYAIMALGVYITYKILDFPDLSVDGTFPLGAAVTVSLIIVGVNPVLTLVISFAAGALAGIITGIIHVKFKVRDLLSGIIMMTALYSINLKIAGKANVAIFSEQTIFENQLIDRLPKAFSPYVVVSILLVIVLFVKILLDKYLKTKSGYLLRAVGDNETIITSLAKDKGMIKILGLAIANALAALAGSVYCQSQGFFDISTGTGTIVIGLANVIIGTNLFRRAKKIKPTTAVIVGALIYKACVAIAIEFGASSSDLKLVQAILFLVILAAANMKKGKVKVHA
ncbi:MAG: ABC transporter permease [Clostridiales bacterium]|nr:ABC transporter permease [Clostridiales bacterium]